MEIICENTIDLLPFITEPLVSLDIKSDLAKYLIQLFNKTGTMITPKGDQVLSENAFF